MLAYINGEVREIRPNEIIIAAEPIDCPYLTLIKEAKKKKKEVDAPSQFTTSG